MFIEARDHKGVTYIKAKNDCGLEVIFSTCGASIYSIKFNDDYMTLTPKYLKDFESVDYHGKIIGRYIGRINHNCFRLNGELYTLEDNENGVTRHGGFNSVSLKNFKYLVKKYKNGVEIIFTYVSKDLEAGFPGTLYLNIIYKFYNNENKLKLIFNAFSDKDTILNLSNHPYFMMGKDDVNDLYLQIESSKYIEPNHKNLVPMKIADVIECLDFRAERSVGNKIEDPFLTDSRTAGYDHYFFFDREDSKKVILRSDKYKLTLETSYPGIQLYSDNYDPHIEFFNTEKNKRRSITLEPCLDTLHKQVLRKGEKYHHFTSYLFEEIGEKND